MYYKVTRFASCLCVCVCFYVWFCVSSFSCHFTDASFSCFFFCFLIFRISIMTLVRLLGCFVFSFYDMLRWLSQYHPMESARAPILLVTNRFFFHSVCGRSEQSAHQIRTNTRLLCIHVQVLFVKESLLVNFFVLLQHLCLFVTVLEK